MKMSLDRSTSTREIDGLLLICIEFYVPTVTPRLQQRGKELQLFLNITLEMVCDVCVYVCVISAKRDI
jgi:hypothetical protein